MGPAVRGRSWPAGSSAPPEARQAPGIDLVRDLPGPAAVHGEEQGWLTQLLQGRSEEQVLGGILGHVGHEFFNRAQTLIGAGTPQERYVQALVPAVAQPPGQSPRRGSWVNDLPALGLQGVVQGFLRSKEYRDYQAEACYTALLGPAVGSRRPGLLVRHRPGRDGLRVGFESRPTSLRTGSPSPEQQLK